MRIQLLVALMVTYSVAGCFEPGPDENGDQDAEPCDAKKALEWRRAMLEDFADKEAFRMRGTDAGERVDFEFHIDLRAKKLHAVDHVLGSTLLLSDEMGYGDDGDGAYAFPDVGQGWFRWILDGDQGEEQNLFTTPAGRLAASCLSGPDRYELSYASGGVAEVWRFMATGDLEYATYADATADTSVRLTQLKPEIPDPPADFTLWPGVFTYEVLYDEVGSDGLAYVGIRVGDGQNGRALGELTLDAFAGDEFVEELPLHPGSEYGTTIGYEYTDKGAANVLDEGDLIDMILDPATVNAWYLYDSWSESYFEEEVLESEDGQSLPWQQGSDAVDLRFSWTFEGDPYELEVAIPNALYDEYGKRSRAEIYSSTYEGYIPDYQAYVFDALDDETIAAIANELDALGKGNGLSDDQILSLTLSFVQSLEYTVDSVTTPFDEFPRYPVETLVELGGDCEDSSILFASLAQSLGYDIVMVSPPGHMAVGVAGDGLPGFSYEHEGTRYYYAETTGEGWKIGELPADYEGASAEVYEVSGARPTLVIDDWTVEDAANGFTSDVWFQFSNTGATDSRRGTATVYALDSQDLIVDQDECTFEGLEAAVVYECELALVLTPEIQDYVFEVTTVDGLRAVEWASQYGE